MDFMDGSMAEAWIDVKIATNQRLGGGRGTPRPALMTVLVGAVLLLTYGNYIGEAATKH